MKKFPKPWYRPSRGVWYVTLDGQQHNLGPDQEAAFERYKTLLAEPRKRQVPSGSVSELIDEFLDWTEKNRAPDTYVWYQSRLQIFVNRYPDLMLSALRPFHIQQWIDSYKLSSGSKRNFARSIMRCMTWCEEQGLIDKNPIRHFKKPRQGVRDQVISPEEYEQIVASIKRQPFKDLCAFAWETGARASECVAVARRHVDLANQRIVFDVAEEKMERAPRIIYLTNTAVDIVKRLILKHPKGPIFRNTDGRAWTPDAANCAFERVEKKLGVKYCLTSFRHSFCHRLLKAGVDAVTVSVLMGHSGISMVTRVYSHLSHAPDYLRDIVKKGGPPMPASV